MGKTIPRFSLLNILFLTKYPNAGASSRYRVYQYLPYLKAQGHTYNVSPFYSDKDFSTIYQQGNLLLKLWMVVKGFVKRIGNAISIFKYDLVYMQREALPFGPLWFERVCKMMNKKMVFDYDDALFIFKASSSTPLSDKFKRPQRIPKIFSMVDCVFAGNDYLTQQAKQFCVCAKTIYVAEDLKTITRRKKHLSSDKLIIGWLGSPSTEKYLEYIRKPLENLAVEFPGLVLLIIGGGRFNSTTIKIRHEQWSLKSQDSLLKEFSIGIMPLPDEEWSKGKSGGKARTYMASGIPCVCTNIGFNRQLIKHEITGYLVDNKGHWEMCLRELLKNAPLRQEVADHAYLEVKQKYSLEVLAPVLEKNMQEVINA